MSLATGRHFRVDFATRSDGTQLARDQWGALSAAEQAVFLALFQRICDHRVINNREKFKKLDEKIFQFKSNSHQLRIACFFDSDGRIYLTNIFRKKEDEAPPREVELAHRIRLEHLTRFSTAKGSRQQPKGHS